VGTEIENGFFFQRKLKSAEPWGERQKWKGIDFSLGNEAE